jgi:hypothetical protein
MGKKVDVTEKLKVLNNCFMTLGGADLLQELAAIKIDFSEQKEKMLNEFIFV